MKIILSPTKTMTANHHADILTDLPEFLARTEEILDWLRARQEDELQKLWNCSDRLAEQNAERIRIMDLKEKLTPAVYAYQGTVFQHLEPGTLSLAAVNYLQKNLRILSAFYGVLKPMDGVTPYRLEMQAKADINGKGNLYDFWGSDLYKSVRDESGVIINLASKEYSLAVEPFLNAADCFITISFMEQHGDKLVNKGTYSKIARGEMLRFMAEHTIEEIEGLKSFSELGYSFCEMRSTDTEFVFVR